MKKIISSILWMMCIHHLSGQDLIVTSENDSINVKITKLKKGVIYFRSMKNDELKKNLLSLDEVEMYEKDFYTTPEIPSKAKLKSDYDGKRFRIDANAGYAYRTAKVQDVQDELFKKYIKSLKSGFNLAFGAHYFINEPLALGLKYNSFYSTKTENNLIASFPNGNVERGLENEISITFIGPSIMTRLLSENKRNALLLSTAIGYMSYRNDERAGERLFKSTGNTIGVSVDLGYDIGLTDFMSIGCTASWTTGVLSELELEENGAVRTIDLVESQGEKEGLSRINISGGVRFYL